MKRLTSKNPGLNDGKRPQEILTPPDIIERVKIALGGIITCDPCSPSNSDPSFFAICRYTKEDNGLIHPWFDGTFFNPPFDDLAPWFEKAATEAAFGKRIVGLVPWRSRRRWFQRWIATSTAVTFEGPVKFVGHNAAIPVDIVLVAWNCIVPGSMIGAFQKGST